MSKMRVHPILNGRGMVKLVEKCVTVNLGTIGGWALTILRLNLHSAILHTEVGLKPLRGKNVGHHTDSHVRNIHFMSENWIFPPPFDQYFVIIVQ